MNGSQVVRVPFLHNTLLPSFLDRTLCDLSVAKDDF